MTKLRMAVATDVFERTQYQQLTDRTVFGCEPTFGHFRDVCQKLQGLRRRSAARLLGRDCSVRNELLVHLEHYSAYEIDLSSRNRSVLSRLPFFLTFL